MATLQTGPFNAMQYDPEMGPPSLPLGLKQPARIVSDNIVAAKQNNNNGLIAFEVEILDGPNKGATGVYRLNIYNSNEKTVEIAYRQLSALSIACGKPTWQDTRELHNLPFLIDVTPQKETEANAGKGYTEISAVYDINGNRPTRNSATGGGNNQQQQQQQNQQQSNNGQWAGGGNSQQQNTQQQNSNWGNGQNPNNQNLNPVDRQADNQQQQNNNQQNANWQQNNNQQQQQQPAGNNPPWMK